MTKFNYCFNEGHKSLNERLTDMEEEDAKLELAEVMKIWDAVCNKLLPNALDADDAKFALKMTSDDYGSSSWISWMDIVDANAASMNIDDVMDRNTIDTSILYSADEERKDVSLFYKNNPFNRVRNYLTDDVFESQVKSQLCEAITSLRWMFSGKKLSFRFITSGSDKMTDSTVAGCAVSKAVLSCVYGAVKFTRCENIEDVVAIINACDK